jgi:2-oxoglutarate dehydrogenase E2 component (dihydrolipoamide succinyltransferase)
LKLQLGKDGDYVEKTKQLLRLILIKLELPAEASGIITLKAEEGDAVAVEQFVN